MDTLYAILNQLKEYSGRIELYMYNEPLMDKRLYWIVKEVRRLVPRSAIMLASNGDFLTKEKVIDLFEAGLNQMQLNDYVGDRHEKYKDWLDSVPGIDFKRSYTQSVHFNCAPYKRIAEICDKSKDLDRYKLVNRSGLIPGNKIEQPLKKMCVKPFRLLNINWKGDAVICCNDYFGAVTPGNVMDVSLEDIWNSPLFNSYREILLARRRDLPLCRTCDSPAGAYVGNIALPDGATLTTEQEIELMKSTYPNIEEDLLCL
jgi:MoaA/NifB/PqqE/SkfB family radical SAM enzyme